MELSIDRLTKQYQNKIAVDRISLRLNTGIYGLLGANGAGKTTLMRMVWLHKCMTYYQQTYSTRLNCGTID